MGTRFSEWSDTSAFCQSENGLLRMMMGPYYELGKVLGIEAKRQAAPVILVLAGF